MLASVAAGRGGAVAGSCGSGGEGALVLVGVEVRGALAAVLGAVGVVLEAGALGLGSVRTHGVQRSDGCLAADLSHSWCPH